MPQALECCPHCGAANFIEDAQGVNESPPATVYERTCLDCRFVWDHVVPITPTEVDMSTYPGVE